MFTSSNVCPGTKLAFGIASKRRRSRALVLHLTWMEAESCKSSCCRRGRMDEDWVMSSKTNMYLGSGLMLPSAVVMSSLSSMNCRIKHTTTLSPLSKPPIFEAPTSSRSPT